MRSRPSSWERIPAVPAPAFKEAAITTFDPATAVLAFETSGTTQGKPGRHYMQTATLYDAALCAGFERFVVPDGARLRYFNLVPNPAQRPQSSLGYMMERAAQQYGDGKTGWYLRGDELLLDSLLQDLHATIADAQPVCIAATVFALVHLLDCMQIQNVGFDLPAGSRIMETGGFKGRARVVDRDELHRQLRERFNLPAERIIGEYGMTELSSQYYDATPARTYVSPPWLRVRIVDADRTTLPNGSIGSLLHVDLANRSSCIAIQTEDLGFMTTDGLVLLGREGTASARGCSLDAETLAIRN